MSSHWLSGLSRAEVDEMYNDACSAFNASLIDEKEFRTTLGTLGYNATDIEDCVKQHRPPPPENGGD